MKLYNYRDLLIGETWMKQCTSIMVMICMIALMVTECCCDTINLKRDKSEFIMTGPFLSPHIVTNDEEMLSIYQTKDSDLSCPEGQYVANILGKPEHTTQFVFRGRTGENMFEIGILYNNGLKIYDTKILRLYFEKNDVVDLKTPAIHADVPTVQLKLIELRGNQLIYQIIVPEELMGLISAG